MTPDRTDRKLRSADRAAAQEKLLAEVVESTGVALYRSLPDERETIVYASAAFVRLVGGEVADLASRPSFFALIHPDDISLSEAEWLQRLPVDEPAEFTFRLRCADGSYRWVRDHIVASREEDGAIRWLDGALVDITAQKDAEAAAQLSEHRHRTFLDYVPLPISIKDSESRYVFVNAAHRKLNDVRPEDIVGKTVDAVQSPEVAEFIREQDRKVLGTGEPQTVEFAAEFRGNPRLFIETRFPFSGETGKPALVVTTSRDITDERRAQAELSESEAKFRGVLENLPGAVFRQDPDEIGTFNFVSEGVRDLAGYEPDELIGKAMAFLVHPEDYPGLTETALVHMRSGAPMSAEYRIKRKDGSDVWVSENSRMIFAPSGEATSFDGVLIDITAQKEAEAALRDSEARYARAVAGAEDGIWDWNIETGEEYFSPRCYEMAGYTPGEFDLNYETFRGWLHPDDRMVMDDAVRAHLDDEAPYDIEFRLKNKGGEYIWLRSRARAERGEDGKPTRMTGFLTDVTERRKALDILRENERLLLLAQQGAKLGYWRWRSADERIVALSEEFRRIWGVPDTVELLTYADTQQYIHSDDRKRIAELDSDIQSDLRDYVNEFRIVHPDGEVVHVIERGMVERDAAGNTIGYVGTLQDITELKRAEDALRENERLLLLAQQGAKLGYWRWRKADNRILALSDEYRRIYGVPDDVEIRTYDETLQYLHPEDRARVAIRDKEVLSELQDYTNEYRILHSDGEIIHVIERATVERDAAGNAVGYIGTLQDVTGMKQAELRLAESEGRMAVAQKLAKLGYWQWDKDGGELFQSREVGEIYGLGPSETFATFEDSLDIIHPDDREHARRNDLAHMAELKDFSQEFRVIHADGSVRNIYELGVVNRDPSGNPLGYIGVLQDITDVRRIETRLSDARNRLAVAQKIAKIGYWECDAEGRNMFLSDEVRAMYGIGPEQRIDSLEDSLSIMHPDDAERLRTRDLVHLAEPHEFQNEYRIIRPGGEVRHIHEIAEIRRDQAGRPAGFAGIVQDITERVSERDAAARLGRIVESSRSEIYSFDAETLRFVTVNLGARKNLGYTEEEMRGLTPLDLKPEITPERFAALIAPLRDGARETVQFQTLHRRKDGSTYEVDIRLQLMVQESPPVFVAFVEDITERLAAERRLAAAQQAVGLGHWQYNRDSGSLWVSDELSALFGLPPGERLETDEEFHECVHPDDRERVVSAYAEQTGGGEFREFMLDYRIVRRDGAVRNILDHYIVDRDSEGRAVGYTGVVQDITERVEAERQLHQAQKMQVVGQLTGGVAHDFNNLLAVVLGRVEMIERSAKTNGDADVAANARAAIEAAIRGGRLTQHLLSFSRRQPLAPRSVGVAGLVDGWIEVLGRTLGETVAVETGYSRDLWRVQIDPGQLEVALLNLAINGRDAMSGGGTLTIRAENRSIPEPEVVDDDALAGGDYVALSVADTGTGMAPEVLDRVFEPFFTTKEVGQGSGLGLSMVYGFARQSGGGVTIESEPGKGTTVTLLLPRAEGAGSDEAAVEKKLAPVGEGELVLVVEDDPDVLAVAVESFAALGYRTVEAEDGASALAILAGRDDIALLFSDVVMPGGMSGGDLAREVRRHHPALKVLLTSSYPEDALNWDAADGERPALLKKPYRIAALGEIVRGTLDAGSGL